MADHEDSPSFRKRVEDALAAGLPIPDFPDVSPLAGVAMAQHEAAEEFEKAGFARNEAIFLTAAMFSGNPGAGPVH